LEPAGTDNTVSWQAISGARVRWDSGNAADNCRVSLALAARWRHLMSLNLAATNKFLAPINKSQTAVKATKKRIRQQEAVVAVYSALPEDEFHKTMTLREAKSIARHLGLNLRQVRSGAYQR
jgi:hypothetical protein